MLPITTITDKLASEAASNSQLYLIVSFCTQTEIESTKTELNRELATLKKYLLDSSNPELMTLKQEKQQLTAKVEQLEKEAQAKTQQQPDEKDQAVSVLNALCVWCCVCL